MDILKSSDLQESRSRHVQCEVGEVASREVLTSIEVYPTYLYKFETGFISKLMLLSLSEKRTKKSSAAQATTFFNAYTTSN